ncbi:MAG TPA: hypothetical protein VEQ37_00080 [Actinomycetota bacterium]|nr:hypothetical protein [Actinomycetota bacterium]
MRVTVSWVTTESWIPVESIARLVRTTPAWQATSSSLVWRNPSMPALSSPGSELRQAHVGDPPVVEGEPQGRLPRQVEAAPALSLPVGHPIEELGEQQRGEHRRRVGGASPRGGVQVIEVIIGEERPPGPPKAARNPSSSMRSPQSASVSQNKPWVSAVPRMQALRSRTTVV